MKLKLSVALSVGLLLLSGCSSIVKKPEVDKVKTVAVISIFANSDVREKKARGSVKGWKKELKQEVAGEFLDIYQDSLAQVGWKVVPADKIIGSKEYKEAFRPAIKPKTDNKTVQKMASFMNKMADMAEQYSYFTPVNMHPIELNSQALRQVSYVNGKRVDKKAQLAEFARKMGVDAVAVIELDYCYEGAISIGGTGSARMTAASTIRAIDQKGNMVVNMGDLQRCQKTKNRGESDQKYAMVGGNLVVAFAKQDKLKKMFMQSTRENAELTVQQLKKAMKK
jgi:hypothetical protein